MLILKVILILAAIYHICGSSPAYSAPNTLDTLIACRKAMVTVEGIRFIIPPESERKDQTRVETRQTTGAGVIIGPEGTIVTNTHVLYGSERVLVTLPSGQQLPAAIIYISPSEDFSFIKTLPSAPLSAVSWGDSDTLHMGDQIATIGHSDILNGTISGGVVAGMGTVPTENGQHSLEVIRLNINHYQGDSGGPVFNRSGCFIALMSAKRLTKNRFALAIPANKIHFAYIHLDKAGKNH